MAENDIGMSREDVIFGRNPVMEAIRSGRTVDKVFVVAGSVTGSAKAIIAKCKDRKIPVKEVPQTKLDFMCGGGNHQGIAATVSEYSYSSVDDILSEAEKRGEKPFVILCDGIEDPHNLGAIIRTAECVGAHGVIIPERRSASLTATVAKASSGALEYVKVARVTNLASTMEHLKEKGVWFYAADMDGESWCGTDLSGAVCLVIGSEGEGVGRLVKEKCDGVISLPMKGKINSLNASVAAGVAMYEAARQRAGIKAINIEGKNK